MKDSPQLATAGVVIGPPGVVAGDPKGQPLSNPNTLGDAGTATWRGCDSQLQRRRLWSAERAPRAFAAAMVFLGPLEPCLTVAVSRSSETLPALWSNRPPNPKRPTAPSRGDDYDQRIGDGPRGASSG